MPTTPATGSAATCSARPPRPRPWPAAWRSAPPASTTCSSTSSPATCRWGAGRDSGIGFRHGEYGIKKFVRPESLVITAWGRSARPLLPLHREAPQAAQEDRDLLQRQGLAPQARPRPRRLAAKGAGGRSPGPAARQARASGARGPTARDRGGRPAARTTPRPCAAMRPRRGCGRARSRRGPHRRGASPRARCSRSHRGRLRRPASSPSARRGRLVLERQPGAVAEQQRLRLATPHLHALRFLPHLVPPSLCGQSREITSNR